MKRHSVFGAEGSFGHMENGKDTELAMLRRKKEREQRREKKAKARREEDFKNLFVRLFLQFWEI